MDSPDDEHATHEPELRARIERGVAEGWIRAGSGEPVATVKRVEAVPGTPDTTELIRSDRDS